MIKMIINKITQTWDKTANTTQDWLEFEREKIENRTWK